MGEDSWENPANGLIANVYYGETLESLQPLMQHPQAKAAQAQWLDGYQVVIAEVLRACGDGAIDQPSAP